MKKIISALIVLSGISATANVDWGRQVCESNHGVVKEINLQFSLLQKIEVCYLGQAIIDLNTLDLGRMNSFGGPEANRVYRQTRNHDYNVCEKNFGRSRRGQEAEGTRIYNICEFSDRSYIGTDTLTDGVSSPWNRELNSALGIF